MAFADTDEIIAELSALKTEYNLALFDMGDDRLDFAYKKVDDALRRAIEIVKRNNQTWVSVEDRLPDKPGSYLVIGKSGGATVTRWYMPNEYHPKGHFGGNSSEYIRYWMPRPKPPVKLIEER